MTASYDFVSASTLLRDGIYEVPDYQRNFAWDAQQLRDLWEDVTAILPDSDHYTGTIIVKKLEDLTRLGKAFSRFELIDGQQRLTSIVLLLASLCEELRKSANADSIQTASNVLTEYIHDASTDTHKLRLNRGDDSYLKEVVLKPITSEMVRDPETPSEVKLRDAKRYFARQLVGKAEVELQELVGKVLSRLQFTRFQVGNDAEAGLIFEVTNNRGRALNQLDKIKNYLMYVSYKAGDPDLATSINAAWAEILRNMLSSAGLADEAAILRYHWMMRSGETKEYDVHGRLKLLLRPPFGDPALGYIREYVKSLKEASYVIEELSHPESAFQDWPVREVGGVVQHLSGLARLRIFATFLPLVVASRITLRSNSSLVRSIAAACEAYGLRVYKVANRRADTGLSVFGSQAARMFNGRGNAQADLEVLTTDVITAIKNSADRYGNDETVRSVLSGESVYGESLDGYEIRHILGEFERWKCAEAKESALAWPELEKASIEHILAQNPEGFWSWTTEERNSHGRLVNRLGNLTLTFWNSQLSNKPFAEKRLKYDESNLRIQRELSARPSWGEAEIKQRGEELTDFVLARWALPHV